jgi:hypothetical protein
MRIGFWHTTVVQERAAEMWALVPGGRVTSNANDLTTLAGQ